MIPRASSASSKSTRLLSRSRLPQLRNVESSHFWQLAHNPGGYTGPVTHTAYIQIDSPNPVLEYPTRIQSSSLTSIGLRQSRLRTQYSRLQTSRPFSSSPHTKSSFAFSLLESDPSMASLTPPQAPPRWNHTPEEVLSITKQALAQNKAVSDRVGALPEAECNFETVRDLSCAPSPD